MRLRQLALFQFLTIRQARGPGAPVVGWPFVSHPSHEIIRLGRPPAPKFIVVQRHLPRINLVKQRGEHRPRSAQLIAAQEVLLVAPQRLQNEAGVGVWNNHARVPMAVVQLQLADLGVHFQARSLHHDL